MGTSTSTGTLTAGQSRTFNLAPASAVTLTLLPNVRVTITESPAAVTATGLGGNATRVHVPRLPGTFTYGPYPMGGSVVVDVDSNSGSSVSWLYTSSIFTAGFTGSPYSVGSPQLKNSVILLGDSFTGRSWKQVSLSAGGITNNGDGTATATMTTAPNSTTNQITVGETIRVEGSSTPIFNQIAATITAVSNSPTYSITYTITGEYADTPFTDAPVVYRYNRQSVKGWWTFYQKLANAQFDVVANCAQGGTQIRYMKQMLERQYPTVTARFGFFQGGINDIYVGSRTLAEMIEDATALIDAVLPRVAVFVAFTIPAMSASKTGWTLARANQQLQFNRWLAEYVSSNGGICIESNLATSNAITYGSGSDTNGAPNSGFVTDNTHPTPVGAYALAKAAYAKTSSFVVQDARWPSNAIDSLYYDADSQYMLDASHVLMSGTGGTVTAGSGTITGTAPDGTTIAWVTSGSGLTATVTTPARTVADDGDTIGDNLVVTLSGTAGALSLLRFSVAATVGRFALADVIRAIAKIKITTPTGILAVNTMARVVQASMARWDSAGMEDVDTAFTEGATYYDVTPWLTILSGNGAISSVTFIVDMWVANGAVVDDTVITIAHPNIQKQVL